METMHRPQNCRWAMPTLLLAHPFWCDAWEYPWACVAQPTPRPLRTAEECARCPLWEVMLSTPGHGDDASPRDRRPSSSPPEQGSGLQ